MGTNYTILAVKLCKRRACAEEVQKVLTKYGCVIRMRLGVHEAGDFCSDEGLVILQLVPGAEEIGAFKKELDAVEGAESRLIEL
ncbi:MAG: hypothetical protein P4L75_06035 [Clostridia bacterium]|nr:hypothetical protein [Clostridia bacterium]MDR3644195.1 hypothetical protein [Clostridia bacterium]